MILIAILSLILIWVHVSSLRFIVRSNSNQSLMEETQRLEDSIPEEEKNAVFTSGAGLFSLIVIAVLNLIEIGYFIACVYFFGGMIITIISSIIIGYSIYSLIKFIPNMKKYYSRPSEYLREKTTGVENILSFIMPVTEILFCIYIIVIISLKYLI
jgi:hypothetical protein